jgi:hypothetical protein
VALRSIALIVGAVVLLATASALIGAAVGVQRRRARSAE